MAAGIGERICGYAGEQILIRQEGATAVERGRSR